MCGRYNLLLTKIIEPEPGVGWLLKVSDKFYGIRNENDGGQERCGFILRT